MRKYIYLLFVIIFAFVVYMKSRGIKAKWRTETISIEKLWKKEGKPVNFVVAEKRDLNLYNTISGLLKNPLLITAMIPSESKDKVKVGQKFHLSGTSSENKLGAVSHVSDIADVFTGLFKVDLKLFKPINSIKLGDIVMVSVTVGKITGQIILPLSAVITENKKFYLWIIEDNRAIKREIIPGNSNESFIEIISGIKSGEYVVLLGKENLIQNDLVKINNITGDVQ